MARPQDKRVLVVDDEPDVVTYLRTALEDAGFQTEPAHSVDDALEKIKVHPPDCISLDMVMPRKSGIVLFHALRRSLPWSKIPVLFVTGHAREEVVRRDLDAASSLAESTLSGPSTSLEKPVTAETFVRAVANLVNVELEEAGGTPELPDNTLKRQVLELLNGADSDTLRKALKVLGEGKPQ
ncbi:MAG TPA: response regulator [Candidatus Methylomirabilis sp.]|nr:response regulator [Candidatus Methylomirabilis sp.]